MRQALITMLTMQDRMNTRVHPEWAAQNFAWYRALWIECGELIEHVGYKWWKKQEADMEQVRLEVIDIWHFGMSALFSDGRSISAIAQALEAELADFKPQHRNVHDATEALALYALQNKGFSARLFWELMLASGLDFGGLYRAYVGKNVLNFFRQDNGYQEGNYVKSWAGREDNEHLVELLSELDDSAEDFSDQVYQALTQRYADLVSAA